MILNVGGRTDIVQYYTPWLLARFRNGYVMVRNPYDPHHVTRYDLDPATIDGVVFCSKNYAPILPYIGEITQRFHTYFHYTITAYGRDIEPGVPSIEESIDTLYKLEEIVGKNRISWRYDPVLLTKEYTVKRHAETFSRMADRLKGHVDRCIFSFVELYRKLQFNFPDLIPLTDADMDTLAMVLGTVAGKAGIPIQSCGTDTDYSRYGIGPSGCMTLSIMGRANGIRFRRLQHNGMRKGCHCIESRDIGAYDTCLNGCKYCYANTNLQKAVETHCLHDPASPLLIGHPEKGDIVTSARQISFRVKESPQLELL
ncbi:MAG: DUF1848 domain-containing protein [Sphaerochaetaceae bacterium]